MQMTMSPFILLTLFLVYCIEIKCQITTDTYNVHNETLPIVQTLSGDILGNQIIFANEKINTFLGIPYAQPPVGNLRFAKPVPVKPWIGKTLNAQKLNKACYQPSSDCYNLTGVEQTEDCLYLNVYAPANVTNQLIPVMVSTYYAL